MSDTEEGTPGSTSGGESAPGSRPLVLSSAQSAGPGKALPSSFGDSTVRQKARPLPTNPDVESEYSGPPTAPLTGAPLAPLTGTRRAGGARPSGWSSHPSRAGAQYTSEPPKVGYVDTGVPRRQYSRPIVAGLSVLVVLMLTAAAVGGFKLVDSYGVQRPLSQPSVKKSEAPLPIPPDVTVTVTASVVPDLVRLRQNEIYAAGKVAAVSCQEPAIKPDSQSAILRYYRALLPCLDKAWEPVLKKAGYPFRSPKVVLQTNQVAANACTGEKDVAYYCPADESINISWKEDAKFYKSDPLAARVWMIDTMAHEYGHHVQNLTEMLTASWSREGWAKTEAEKLEWSRRTELQASCLGAAFLGANKKALGLSGQKLRVWEYEMQHSGDEYSEDKVRDHGSRKSHWLWTEPAFASGDPKSCNTFTAPSAKVG
ncbi:neutral zinc metallopeptidase [Kribbella sp. NPDC048915]|uniref:neutral zinc metallopeptidase n=1 Tax=Kribbella sp. NPDC048915 TaxID=3155148 RepID=UPI0033E1B08D